MGKDTVRQVSTLGSMSLLVTPRSVIRSGCKTKEIWIGKLAVKKGFSIHSR